MTSLAGDRGERDKTDAKDAIDLATLLRLDQITAWAASEPPSSGDLNLDLDPGRQPADDGRQRNHTPARPHGQDLLDLGRETPLRFACPNRVLAAGGPRSYGVTMSGNKWKFGVVGVAAVSSVFAMAPAFALGFDEGSISCSNVARVQSRTSGDTYVSPPAEGSRYIGTYGSLTTKLTHEAFPNDGHWEVLSSGGIDVNETAGQCTSIPW
ncbi:MAG: hypothetical protein ABIR39_19175 [Nocardioides sp.]|uniref:hypothetical protein n=1 Tax=Nocardioides sp. TaxID=35761 RepID=UPI00326558DD